MFQKQNMVLSPSTNNTVVADDNTHNFVDTNLDLFFKLHLKRIAELAQVYKPGYMNGPVDSMLQWANAVLKDETDETLVKWTFMSHGTLSRHNYFSPTRMPIEDELLNYLMNQLVSKYQIIPSFKVGTNKQHLGLRQYIQKAIHSFEKRVRKTLGRKKGKFMKKKLHGKIGCGRNAFLKETEYFYYPSQVDDDCVPVVVSQNSEQIATICV